MAEQTALDPQHLRMLAAGPNHPPTAMSASLRWWVDEAMTALRVVADRETELALRAAALSAPTTGGFDTETAAARSPEADSADREVVDTLSALGETASAYAHAHIDDCD